MFRAVLKEKKAVQIELRGARGVQPSKGLSKRSRRHAAVREALGNQGRTRHYSEQDEVIKSLSSQLNISTIIGSWSGGRFNQLAALSNSPQPEPWRATAHCANRAKVATTWTDDGGV